MSQASMFPSGEELKAQVKKRHRSGTFWRILFQAPRLLALLRSLPLLYNIINESFGLVAVEYARSPESLVLAYEEERLLTASNTLSSEDDNELAAAIQGNPDVCAFWLCPLPKHADSLKLLSVDGVTPRPQRWKVANILWHGRCSSTARPTSCSKARRPTSFSTTISATLTQRLKRSVTFLSVRRPCRGRKPTGFRPAAFNLQPGQWANVDPAGLGGAFSVVGSSTVFP